MPIAPLESPQLANGFETKRMPPPLDVQTDACRSGAPHRTLGVPAASYPALGPVQRTGPTIGRVLVTVATYNEIENLPPLVDEILAAVPDADVLIVDDNSPDGTGRWCDEKAAAEPRVKCVHRAGKLGLGTALVAAMRYAIEHDYAYMINMDADFSHPPRNLPDLIGGMEDDQGQPRIDVMIGSRYVSGGRIEGWPWRRHLMSRGVNLLARMCLGLVPRDCSGAFRCYRVEMLKRLDFAAIRSRGYSFQEEILWRLKRLGARMEERPITFVDRQRGQSKIDRHEALGALRVLLSLGTRNWLGLKDRQDAGHLI